MIKQDDSLLTKIRKIAVLYAKMIAAVFGVLILGFIAFAIFKGTIEPRLNSAAACISKDGCLFPMVNGRSSVRVVGFSAEGSTILTRGPDILIHDAANGNKLGDIDPDGAGNRLVIAGDGSLIAALDTRNNELDFFTPDGESVDGWVWPAERDIRDMAFLPSAAGYALSGTDGVTMWRIEDGKQFTTLPGSEGAGMMVTSADGNWLAALKRDEDALYIWPLESIAGVLVINEVGLADGVVWQDSLQISADGSRVASFNDETASVWNSSDGDLLLSVSLKDVAVGIDHIGFAANGERLAVGYDDGVVEVWTVDEQAVLQLFEHGQKLNGVALSPDGTQLAVGQSRDSVVTVITGAERAAAQRQAVRNLSVSRNLRESTGGYEYLTPGNVYIDTIPGYALVWEVAP